MVEAAKLSAMIQTFDGKDCTIEIKEKEVILRCEKDKYTLRALDSKRF